MLMPSVPKEKEETYIMVSSFLYITTDIYK